MTLGTLNLGYDGIMIYSYHAGFFVSTARIQGFGFKVKDFGLNLGAQGA